MYDTTVLVGERKQEGRKEEGEATKFPQCKQKWAADSLDSDHFTLCLLTAFGFPAVIREPLTALISEFVIHRQDDTHTCTHKENIIGSR